VRRGTAAIEFYKAAFGARELLRVGDESSVVARLAVDGAEFWLADESQEHLNFSPETLGGCSVRMLLMVDDPEAVCERAVECGATLVAPVYEQQGWRIGRILDPFGHHWEIAREP
jgi:PhnB protein